MARIDQILEETHPAFSFEFFPPKTDEGEKNLREALEELRKDRPSYVSVTYGAGGSRRDRTIELVKWIKQDLGIEAMAHFTCVAATVEDLRSTLDDIREAGIDNVLALRGDPPSGEAEWRKTDGGLEFSTQLIDLIRGGYDFAVGAACFPEVHPQAENPESDIRFLKEKVDAGATFLITQLFFDNTRYFEFVERAREAGITVPIIPGIMPVTNYAQIKRMSDMCGASFPEQYEAELEARKDDPDATADLGVAYATLQCADLLARGAPGIHFYTLNRSPATRAILAALRAARPWDRAAALV
jgi:methylenetetrahydrofolate reductase (NADPH)